MTCAQTTGMQPAAGLDRLHTLVSVRLITAVRTRTRVTDLW